MHSVARGQPIPSICLRPPERPVAARRESPFWRKGDDAALIRVSDSDAPSDKVLIRSCRSLVFRGLPAGMRSGRPCVVGAVQVTPIPRIRPREVQRYDGGSEAHGASKSHPSVDWHHEAQWDWSRIGMGLLCARIFAFSPNPAIRLGSVTAVARPLQGPLASVSQSAPEPAALADHLCQLECERLTNRLSQGLRPSSGPILPSGHPAPMLPGDAGGCDMDPRRAARRQIRTSCQSR